MNELHHRITHKQLFFLWFPLAVMWIVMAVEQPLITSVVARLQNPTIELAAFGYAFAIALLIEGPVVQMLSAGTAISHSYTSYRRILAVMHSLAVICTGVHLLLAIPGVYQFLALRILGLPEQLVEPSYRSFLAMIPWTAAVGYRRLWQGVMIRYGKAKQVPIVMYLRITAAVIVLGIGLWQRTIPGAVLGGLTLTVGVSVGAVAAWAFTRHIVTSQMPKADESSDDLPLSEVIRFYIPLGLTSLITLGIRPLLNYGISRGAYPVDSLALWPVVLAYTFIYTSISQSLQEIIIAQYKERGDLQFLRSFVLKVVGSLTLFYLVIYLTPLKNLWFITISGVPRQLLYLLPVTLGVLVILPGAAAMVSLYRGILVSERQTKAITAGVSINAVSLLSMIVIASAVTDIPGVYIAAAAYSAAFVFEIIYLIWRTGRLFATS
ncbi:MAG: hypothetical protein ACQEQU_01635 [Spirochaetota bacterium]